MACAAAEANGDGTGGYILRDDASATASWTFAFGGDVLKEDNTGYVYNSQATIDSMTMLKRMLDNGCAYFFTEATRILSLQLDGRALHRAPVPACLSTPTTW